MATPASSAWHRRRSVHSVASSFEKTPQLSSKKPPSYYPTTAPAASPSAPHHSIRSSEAPPAPLPTLRKARAAPDAAPISTSVPARPRAHVLLAKAAQAGAIFFTAVALLFPIVILSFISCSWPSAALAREAAGLVGTIQTLIRVLAALAILAFVVVFHAVTLSNLRSAPRALPLPPQAFAALFRPAVVLRHMMALSLAGAVQLPAFAVLIHGFRISRVVRARVAPSWLDLQLCLILGCLTGLLFSFFWFVTGGYVLRVSPERAPMRTRVRNGLLFAFHPSAAVVGIAGFLALVLNILAPSASLLSHSFGKDIAAAQFEGASSTMALDFSAFRRWWICVEAATLCVACWTLSSVIVSVLLTQPYNFVLEAQVLSAAAEKEHGKGLSNGKGRSNGSKSVCVNDFAVKNVNPAILDNLVFALTASSLHPQADPTGVLASLSLQDLSDIVTVSPAGRAPIFADPSGNVWHHIMSACLLPIDKLSYKLWLRANSQQSELPSLFSGGADVGWSALHNDAVDESIKNCDEVLFGNSQRILHAANALANVLVASRDHANNEDRFGVAQRGLVDVITSLLQCHSSCKSFRDAQLFQDRRLFPHSSDAIWFINRSVSHQENDEKYFATATEEALTRSLREIVNAFHSHLCGYLDAQEPRWNAKFNGSLSTFLHEVDQYH